MTGQSKVLAGTCQDESSQGQVLDKGRKAQEPTNPILKRAKRACFAACIMHRDRGVLFNSIFDFFLLPIIVEGILPLIFYILSTISEEEHINPRPVHTYARTTDPFHPASGQTTKDK